MTDPNRTEPMKPAPLRDMLAGAQRLLSPVLPRRWRADAAIVPVIRMTGVIGFATPLRPGITLAGFARALDRAFGISRIKAVALAINSPGGSAAQSHLIFRRIRQLADEKGVPVIAAVEDVAASGGYMIACAADEIVCDATSIVGSIGVIGATFGLQEAIRKLGIERRVYTAGDHKSMLDPFLPEKPDDVERIKAIQHDIHRVFIDLVRSRRGERLTGPENTLFSGEYWTASMALGHGLVDRIGDLRSLLRERYGEQVVTPLITPERGLLGRRTPGIWGETNAWADRSIIDEVVSSLETRAIWARYGL
jgi:signal peptide peptidase SppA